MWSINMITLILLWIHKYTIFAFWLIINSTLACICSFLVDGLPIRQFKNLESYGIPFPTYQPMRLYSSLWNADNWATRGGLVKIDWTQSPFTASYKNFNANGCIWSYGTSSCDSNSPNSNANKGTWYWEKLDYSDQGKMAWVQNNYMIYNYCTDTKRFPQGFAPECYLTNLP